MRLFRKKKIKSLYFEKKEISPSLIDTLELKEVLERVGNCFERSKKGDRVFDIDKIIVNLRK